MVEEKVKPKKEVEEEWIFKDNFSGLEYIEAQEPEHKEMLKMTIRGAIAAMNGKKLSYKDVVKMPYVKCMKFIGAFNKKHGEAAFLSKKE